MNKYIAIINKKTNICLSVSILQEVPEADEWFNYIEVDSANYQNKIYIDQKWESAEGKYDGEKEKWLDEYLAPPEETTFQSLKADIAELRNRIDAKIDYDLQIHLERDFQLAMIEIHTAKGGE